jgi:5-methylcytosine-specific restriction endonuclease McrA
MQRKQILFKKRIIMIFNGGVILNVKGRQYDGSGNGFTCAKCGTHAKESSDDWFFIPRIPVNQGGKRIANCVIVCSNCNKELGQDGNKNIPRDIFPFWDVRQL